MSKFISCVRFEGKVDAVNTLNSRLRDFNLPEGASSHVVVKTGETTFCTFIQWDSENDLINARPEMISYLDTIRDLLVELPHGKGVTDPVSGPILHSVVR